jgi:hypothetical protein
VAGGPPAAFLYVGEDPEPDTVANISAKIRKARKRHAADVAVSNNADVMNALDEADDRLCVVYRENHVLRFYRPSEYASITNPADQSADDITGEHQ